MPFTTSRLFSVGAFFALPLLTFLGCGDSASDAPSGSVDPTPERDSSTATTTDAGADAAPPSDDGGAPDASADGATLPRACTVSQDCTEGAGGLEIVGTCFHGVCVCNAGYVVQTSGKCGKTPAPDCMTQGGSCHQQPATCPATALEGSPLTNMTCGDFIPAVCCLDKATCKGPVEQSADGGVGRLDFVCCAPGGQAVAPICVNGWQTCANEYEPATAAGGCK